MTVAKVASFLESIGLTIRFDEVTWPTFLPGVALKDGVLIVDQSGLQYPGDLLNLAGHLAVLGPGERAPAHEPVRLEPAALAWARAAAKHLGLDPAVVFRIVQDPDPRLLESAGLTTAATYPVLSPWLRDELSVRHLRHFWNHQKDVDWVVTNTLLSGLGLGLRETFDYLLQEKPSFAEFEAWIAGKNGGAVAADRIEQLNTALSEAGAQGEPANPDAEPALSAEDLAFWDENGYVIPHSAVPEENRQAAVQAICEFLRVDLDRPETWYGGVQGHSIWIPLLHHPAIWSNRKSDRIHRAFAQLWNREDLWGSVDQAGFNPPVKPGWQFPGPHLHWDVSLASPIPFGVQGILYLTDTAANQGAFTCVPGFHRRIGAWLKSLPAGANPRDCDFSSEAVRIAGRAGDLVIWHHALPHGASPNTAAVPRIVQYIAKRPSRWGYNPVWA